MLFKALNYQKQHDAEYTEIISPKTYRCKFSHEVQENLLSHAHLKYCVKFSLFDTGEKRSVVMHHG
jgi:hypothetical protein